MVEGPVPAFARAHRVAARARAKMQDLPCFTGPEVGARPARGLPMVRRVVPLLTSAVVLLASPSPAFASDEPAPVPASEPAPEPATEPVDEVRMRHRRGLELYDEGDYRLALVEFERAYAISRNFKILYNIGQVHFQLTSYAKARRALEQYLALGGDAVPAARRADVTRDLATLAQRTATLSVHVDPPGADVLVDGESSGKAPLERVLVDAGTRRVQVSRAGHLSTQREVTLAGGDSETLTIELASVSAAPPEATASGLPGTVVASWIVTGVLTAGAVGTGIAALSAASTYDTKRTSPVAGSAEEARSDLERQRSLVSGLALTTDILVGLAVAGAGVSLYLTLRERPRPTTPAVRVQGTAATLSVAF